MNKVILSLGILVVIASILEIMGVGQNSVCYNTPTVNGCYYYSNGIPTIIQIVVLLLGIAIIGASAASGRGKKASSGSVPVITTSSHEMRACLGCGTINSDAGAKFCKNCGRGLN